MNTLRTQILLQARLLLFSSFANLACSSLIQTKREYDLNFDYDPYSGIGPRDWPDVKAKTRHHDEWADFHYFMDSETVEQDLDMGYNECESTRRPSPVHLIPNNVCEEDHEILTRQIRFGDCLLEDMDFEIAPNTLRASMPYNDTVCLRPTMDMPNGLPNDWLFTWLEVHVRSEHVIDGRRFDGEINFIHIGTSEQKREIAIPSVLLDASAPRDEPKFQRLLDKWQSIADDARALGPEGRRLEQSSKRSMPSDLDKYRQMAQHRTMGGRFHPSVSYSGTEPRKIDSDSATRFLAANGGAGSAGDNTTLYYNLTHKTATDEERGPIRKMFPYDLWPSIYFYRYKGSLTYPPCSENARWRIFDIPWRISRRQYKQLASLLESFVDESTGQGASVVSHTGENVRPLFHANVTTQNVTHCTYRKYRHWGYTHDQQ
jgi:carbonic anhydrase